MKTTKSVPTKEAETYEKAKAAVMQTIATAEMQGNVYLTLQDMLRRCRSRNAYLSDEEIMHAVAALQQKQLYADGQKIARIDTLSAENNLASICAKRLLTDNTDARANWAAYVQNAESVLNVTLSESQRSAAVGGLSCKMGIITGGAGSGKTTLLKVISEAFWNYCRDNNDGKAYDILNSVLLLAPTGKAARRLSSQAELPAYTIHSVVYTSDSFGNSSFYDSDKQFYAPLIIIDEASMVDMELMSRVMQGLASDTKVLLVGDPAQLPSVGPGLVLQDLMASEIPVFSLTDNFRLETSNAALAHDIDCIRMGNMNIIFDESFRLLNTFSRHDVGEAMLQAYIHLMLDGKDVQMLSPAAKTPSCGTIPLNRRAQALVNPKTRDNPGVEILGKNFRVGDRIVQLVNNKFGRNGDTGCITQIEECDQPVFSIRFDSGNTIRYTEKEISERHLLDHAYALTVHKAQGSEYDYVLIPLVAEQGFMWTHNMIYTAVSRARKGVILVGQESILTMAIQRPLPTRNTDLLKKITRLCRRSIA